MALIGVLESDQRDMSWVVDEYLMGDRPSDNVIFRAWPVCMHIIHSPVSVMHVQIEM